MPIRSQGERRAGTKCGTCGGSGPHNPPCRLGGGQFFLVQGDSEKALRYFRVVLANDPDAVNSALQLCWRATGDANQILDQALPRRADLYLSFLRFACFQTGSSGRRKRLGPSDRIAANISAEACISLFSAPHRQARSQRGDRLPGNSWPHVDQVASAISPSRENLIVNGGFEENLLNGGFDWWYESNPHAALAIDTSEFHGGTRSLSVTFDGQNAPDAGIVQFIPVKPNTEYEFSAESGRKTSRLPAVRVSRSRTHTPMLPTSSPMICSEPILGAKQQARFHTGPNTNLFFENRPPACGTADPGKALDRRSQAGGERN